MEPILIDIKDFSKYINDATSIIWKRHSKRNWIAFSLLIGFGLFLLISSLIEGHDSKTTYTKFNADGEPVHQVTNVYNYHIVFGLGVGLLIVSFYFLLVMYRQKTLIFKSMKNKNSIDESTVNSAKFVITEHHIEYETASEFRRVKWQTLKSFKISHGYVLVGRKELSSGYPPEFIIPVRELTEIQRLAMTDIFRNHKLSKID